MKLESCIIRFFRAGITMVLGVSFELRFIEKRSVQPRLFSDVLDGVLHRAQTIRDCIAFLILHCCRHHLKVIADYLKLLNNMCEARMLRLIEVLV
jgi:hypothetical protein